MAEKFIKKGGKYYEKENNNNFVFKGPKNEVITKNNDVEKTPGNGSNSNFKVEAMTLAKSGKTFEWQVVENSKNEIPKKNTTVSNGWIVSREDDKKNFKNNWTIQNDKNDRFSPYFNNHKSTNSSSDKNAFKNDSKHERYDKKDRDDRGERKKNKKGNNIEN